MYEVHIDATVHEFDTLGRCLEFLAWFLEHHAADLGDEGINIVYTQE